MNDSGSPLVSVLMPSYNAEETIELALASLIAQSYRFWECIVVDDGSTDATVDVVRRISDPRIKLVSLEKNYGRGIARQKSLELACGKYITMLDSDDWIYPDKISKQVSFLEREPDVVLHSMGMAITAGTEILAVRRPQNEERKRLDKLHRMFIPHAPSMIRRSDVTGISYDPNFKLAQDQDFLRRVLVGKLYVVSEDVGYCYTEIRSVSISKIVKGYFYNSRGYFKLIRNFRGSALWFGLIELLKIPYILAFYFFRGERYVISSRSKRPSPKDMNDFDRARSVVERVHDQLVRSRRDVL